MEVSVCLGRDKGCQISLRRFRGDLPTVAIDPLKKLVSLDIYKLDAQENS